MIAVKQFLKLKPQMGGRRAARAIGVNFFTIWRWSNGFRQNGLSGLVPKTPNCGRKPMIEGIKISVAWLRRVEAMILQTGSLKAAFRKAAGDADCPAELRRLIHGRKHVPESLARLVRLKPLPARCWLSADGRRFVFQTQD